MFQRHLVLGSLIKTRALLTSLEVADRKAEVSQISFDTPKISIKALYR